MTQPFPHRPYQPSTFLERGATAPFTTPMLAGTRVRPADRRGLELVVPNPAGGRGCYVLPWTDLRILCRPTVHDTQLTERIASLGTVTPATIRRTAKEIASQGLAGRAASSAALAALAAERDSLIMTNFELLVRLVQQEGSGDENEVVPPTEVERRAKLTIAAIAPGLGQDASAIGASLEQLATLYDPIGLGPRAIPARLPNAIGLLKLLRREAAILPPGFDDQVPALLEMLASTADVTLALAEQAIAEARVLAGKVTGLLAAWRLDPAALGRQLARADWLMDGWERICQLWSLDPSPGARRAVLEEIAALLPIIPREVGEWVGFHRDIETVVHFRRRVPRHHDWRTGLAVQDTVARNEALLAA